RDRAVESGRSALAIAEALEDIPLWIATGTHLGPAYGATGDFAGASHLLTRVVDALREDPAREDMASAGLLSVFSRIYLVYELAGRGGVREGVGWGGGGRRPPRPPAPPRSPPLPHRGAGPPVPRTSAPPRAP